MKKNFYIRHYKSESNGWGKEIVDHMMWLVNGDLEPSIVDEHEGDYPNMYRKVAKKGEDILLDVVTQVSLSEDKEIFYKPYEPMSKFLVSMCKFLNTKKKVGKSKGNYYLNIYQPEDSSVGLTYINLIKTKDKREPITFRDCSGGFIDKDKGDIHLLEMHCATVGAKKRNSHTLGWARNYHSTLNLMKQMCNACNKGVVSYDG
jgi:hypothetical protein